MQDTKPANNALGHIRANLWLLVLSIAIGCVLYPAAVWGVGQLLFHDQAEGSLIYQTQKVDGKDVQVLIGSKQIAQPFTDNYYFQPRPSATSPGAYNAEASTGSNLAASNPKLRGRVASLLGTVSRYSDAYKKAHKQPDSDPTPQADLLAWYGKRPPEQRWFDWANNNPTLAQAWATGAMQDYIQKWNDKHDAETADWKKDNPDAKQPPGFNDLLPYFFRSYEQAYSGKWPASEALSAWVKEKDHEAVLKRWQAANPGKGDPNDDDVKAFFADDSAKNPGDWPPADAPSASTGVWVDVDKKAVVQPTALQDSDVQATFFDAWYTEQVRSGALKAEDFRPVPADMVTTSGSGLDPDITLANALYQEEEIVVPAYAEKLAADMLARDENKGLTDDQKKQKHDEVIRTMTKKIKEGADAALKDLPSKPLFGLAGDEPLVNVLQLNQRWQDQMNHIQAP